MSSDVRAFGLLAAGAALIGGLVAYRKNVLRQQPPQISGAAAAAAALPKKQLVRLPTNVVPSHYAVRLQPDLRTEAEGGTYRFQGSVRVDVDVKEATNKVVMHAVDLSVKRAVVEQNGVEMEVKDVQVDAANEALVLTLPRALAPGTAAVSVDYEGVLNDKLKGFYRSNYTGSDGKPKIMAVTQFEPADARRALPCWDEPAFKATFQVRLVVPEGLTALSNMPEKFSTGREKGLREYLYETSPVMSTYLLAFIVGEFDKIEARTTTDTLVRVFTAPGKAEEGRFALDVAVKTLPYYARYFGVGYPLPKLDMVAIPDFSAGAMENWGLVTYRETAIYVNPATTSAAAQQYVALVVAHELSHQWFGNLATMQWWTDLWLNEGFATWVEYLAVDHIFPEWQIWHQFISSDFTRALKLDGLESSHPVEVEIADSADVDSIFDVISYSKGSCVVRMLVDYLGEQSFRAGMAEYLRAYQYKNATTADLWRSLAQSTGKPVAEVMSSWTLQTGYPLVTVSAAFNADTRTLTVTAEQCRFLTSGAPGGDTVWALPLKVMVAGGSGPAEASTHLVRERKASVSQQLAAETGVPTWIKVNANQAGLYRVAYPPEMLEALRKAIAAADPRLGAVDRLGLQDDAFALARVGTLPVGALLDLVQAFGAETSSAVLSDLAANLAGLSTVLLNSNIYPNYARFASRVFAPVLARVGWDKRAGETQIVSLLRSTAVGNLVHYGHAETRAEALRRFDRFVAAGKDAKAAAEALDPDLRSAAYVAAVAERGAAGYEAVLRVYEGAEMNEEKTRCLRALGAATEAGLIDRTLLFAMQKVRSQDVFIPIVSVMSNRHGNELGWKFIRDNFATIRQRFGGSFQIARILSSLSSFSDHARAEEIEQFFAVNEHPAGERALKQSVEQIRSNAAWLKRDQAAFAAYLAKF